MDLTGIISISGKPGLYKVTGQAKNSVIVESLIDGKRFPAFSSDRISALEDISIYTESEDKPLKEIYTDIFKKENGNEAPSHKEDFKKLESYFSKLLPTYDRDRVYPSDIKKLFQWYNILHKAGQLKLEEVEEVESKKETKPKANTKKAAPKTKNPTTKSATTKKTPSKTSGGTKATKSVQRKSGSK